MRFRHFLRGIVLLLPLTEFFGEHVEVELGNDLRFHEQYSRMPPRQRQPGFLRRSQFLRQLTRTNHIPNGRFLDPWHQLPPSIP